jgi:hypothetical protein
LLGRSWAALGVMKILTARFAALFFLGPACSAFAANPNCAGVNRWATSMAFVHLKNAGLTDNEKLDFTKTETVRLASEKVGTDLYRQLHYIVFTEKAGATIEVITMNDASNEECSMSGVEVFVVSKRLGGK